MADFAINSLDKWNKLVYHSKTIFILTIVIITLTIFFGFLSGIRWGVYGGIAIFVGVLIAWGISFGVTSLVIDAILQKLDFDKVSQGYIKKEDVDVVRKMVFGIIMTIIAICIVIINEIIILIIRKPITKRMRYNKSINKSNALWRLGGGTIAAISVFPIAILAANATGFVSVNNNTINTNDKILSALTFNKAAGVSKYTPGLLSLGKIAADYAKNGNNQDSIVGSIDAYFQEFFKQKNYAFQGKLKDPNFHIDSDPIGTNVDVEFWFGLKQEKDNKIEYETFPKFEDGTVQDVLNGFFASDESFAMFEKILNKIKPMPINGQNITELDKLEEALQFMKDSGINLKFDVDFSNIKIHVNEKLKFHVPNEKYRNIIKQKVFEIASKVISNIKIPKSVGEMTNISTQIGYILQALVNNFIVP